MLAHILLIASGWACMGPVLKPPPAQQEPSPPPISTVHTEESGPAGHNKPASGCSSADQTRGIGHHGCLFNDQLWPAMALPGTVDVCPLGPAPWPHGSRRGVTLAARSIFSCSRHQPTRASCTWGRRPTGQLVQQPTLVPALRCMSA